MQYDVLVGGDWRLEGGITVAVDHEIKALSADGQQLGVIQLDSHLSGSVRPLAPGLAKHVNEGRAKVVADAGAPVTTRLLCLRHPAVIPHSLHKLRRINPGRVVVIVDRPPLDGMGTHVYDPYELHRLLETLFPGRVVWAPISGVCRANLLKASPNLPVLDRDWINFVQPDEWATDRSAPKSNVPVVGRHSRPAWDKWPDSRQQLFAAYPDTPDVKVRILGTGDRLFELAGAIPSNWTLYDWDEIPVPQFVSSIDFFVYYHHSTWIEGFGRTILEAMASGCVAILPEYLRQSFGEAALYVPIEKVREKVHALHRSWPDFLKQSRLGQNAARKRFGPDEFLATVRHVMNQDMKLKMLLSVGAGKSKVHRKAHTTKSKKAPSKSRAESIVARKKSRKPNKSSTPGRAKSASESILPGSGRQRSGQSRTRIVLDGGSSRSADVVSANREHADRSGRQRQAKKGAAPQPQPAPSIAQSAGSSAIRRPSFVEFDVVYLGDLTTQRDACDRISEEIRINATAGYSSALLGLGSPSAADGKLSSCLAEQVLQGAATHISDPGTWIACRLLVLVSPAIWRENLSPRLTAHQVIVIPDATYNDNAQLDHDRIRRVFGENVSWAAVTPQIRSRLENIVPVERTLWTPSVLLGPRANDKQPRQQIVVGHVSQASRLCWPAAQWLNAVYPDRQNFTVNVMGWPDSGLEGMSEPPPNWQVFDADKITLRKFIEKLDFLVFFPQRQDVELPMTAIALAMSYGIPVILPPNLRSAVGRGPIYLEPGDVITTIATLLSNSEQLQQKRAEISNTGGTSFGPQHQQRRLGQHVRPGRPGVTRSPGRSRARRLIMLSSNGTGLGHVTRQLAIARRLSPDIDPVFVTMGHGVGLIRQFGYVAEYIPSQIYTNTNIREWEEWFELEIRKHIDFYGAGLVVFDGNVPPTGLLQAAGPRSDVRLAWIRRGMWQQKQSSVVKLQKYFDVVIEPSDIAGEMDKGATVASRSDVLVVPPIRLLDQEDLLSRKDAAARLGLDPRKASVLIQTGSGSNRDNVGMIDELVRHLKGMPDLQIAIAQWEISSDSLRLWPGTHVVQGFPLSQYFNAFDFTIAAAGYNSFNEIISFGLPAVFVPNLHPSMDDQGGRAEYAERQGAAITLQASNLGEILQVLPLLISEKSRNYIKSNCSRIAMENGATAAAKQLESMMAWEREND